VTTESNRASPRRDATATNNSATYQSQDSQDSEPDTPLLPGCSVMAPPPKPDGAASPAKLAIGVVGIFGAFLYYGQLMGDIVKYQADDGSKLEREWFLQVLEASANVLVGLAGLVLTQGGPSPQIPYKSFLLTGSTQVLAKAMTQKAQIYGVPFFLATLVKNAKMVPVMIGAIVLSGTRYPARKWAQVALIIGGVVLVTVGKARKSDGGGHADVIGMACLGLSLVCDGITGGQQTAFKKEYKKTQGKGLAPYDLMLFTNAAMLGVALIMALALDQFFGGVAFLLDHPDLLTAVAKFSFCSAIGQSAIFFTMANFDPLLVTTVTTTRKIFSVLLDIVSRGYVLNGTQWSGVAAASLGVLGELQEKFGKKQHAHSK
jgi:UDP-galactose transporter B1